MVRFKLGDRVRRQESTELNFVRVGTITKLIENQHGLEIFSEYEVDFGVSGILVAFENQLEAA